MRSSNAARPSTLRRTNTMKITWKLALILPVLLLAACNNTSGNSDSGAPTPDKTAPPAGQKVKIGYVLHVLNDFTQVIKRGAEDAGHDLGVEVEVVGPTAMQPNEEIGMFEGMVQ